jgi:hypothetical protein
MNLRRPSPASVIACLALFFALGGSALAARHYLISSTAQIKPSVLAKLKGGRGPGGPSGASGPQGPQGPGGPQGPAGPSNLSPLTTVEGPNFLIPVGEAESSVATCPPGSHAVSGGGVAITVDGLAVSIMSEDHQSWIAIALGAGDPEASIQAIAYCAGAGQAVAASTSRTAAAHARAIQQATKLAKKLGMAHVSSPAIAKTSAANGPKARVACSRDVPATIGGRHKCLGAGEYCATRYQRQYEHYGFVCSTRYNPPRLRRK